MKQLLYFLLVLFPTINADAQIVERAVHKKIDSLKLSQIDTYLTYSIQCNGSIPIDSCSYETPQYLLWTKSDRYFVQKFDYCRYYQSLEIQNNNPLWFYLNNIQQITKEQVKPPSYIVSRKGNVVKTNSVSVSHSCYHQIELQCNGKTERKTVSEFDLTYRLFDNGKKNMYFEFNQRLKLKGLIERFEVMLKTIEQP